MPISRLWENQINYQTVRFSILFKWQFDRVCFWILPFLLIRVLLLPNGNFIQVISAWKEGLQNCRNYPFENCWNTKTFNSDETEHDSLLMLNLRFHLATRFLDCNRVADKRTMAFQYKYPRYRELRKSRKFQSLAVRKNECANLDDLSEEERRWIQSEAARGAGVTVESAGGQCLSKTTDAFYTETSEHRRLISRAALYYWQTIRRFSPVFAPRTL